MNRYIWTDFDLPYYALDRVASEGIIPVGNFFRRTLDYQNILQSLGMKQALWNTQNSYMELVEWLNSVNSYRKYRFMMLHNMEYTSIPDVSAFRYRLDSVNGIGLQMMTPAHWDGIIDWLDPVLTPRPDFDKNIRYIKELS